MNRLLILSAVHKRKKNVYIFGQSINVNFKINFEIKNLCKYIASSHPELFYLRLDN